VTWPVVWPLQCRCRGAESNPTCSHQYSRRPVVGSCCTTMIPHATIGRSRGMRHPHAGACREPNVNSAFYGTAATTNGLVLATESQLASIASLAAALRRFHGGHRRPSQLESWDTTTKPSGRRRIHSARSSGVHWAARSIRRDGVRTDNQRADSRRGPHPSPASHGEL
jgi:hypothetical protein